MCDFSLKEIESAQYKIVSFPSNWIVSAEIIEFREQRNTVDGGIVGVFIHRKAISQPTANKAKSALLSQRLHGHVCLLIL